jgi:hypothetical protein
MIIHPLFVLCRAQRPVPLRSRIGHVIFPSPSRACIHPLRANFSRSGQVYAYSDEHSQGSRFNVNGLLIGIIESKTRQRSARTIKIAMQRVTSSKPVRHLTAVDFLNHRLV